MVARNPQKNSNLFSIDFEAIEKVLEDANGPLIEKVAELLVNASELPDEINSNDIANEITELLKQLRQLNRQVTQARLSDGRPFTDATKVVKNWFGRTENKLKALDRKLASQLALYTKSVTAKVEAVRLKNASTDTPQIENQTDGNMIGQASDGMPIVKTNTSQNPIDDKGQSEPEIPKVKLDWEVKSINPRELDLEGLRPFFSEHSLKLAINSHMRKHGPNKLNGVVYEQVVSKKL